MGPVVLKSVLLVLSIAAGATGQSPACPKMHLPSEFNLKEQVVSWTTTLAMTGPSGESYGNLKKQLFSWGTEFDYTNENGTHAGKANAAVFSWGHQIDVKDCQGNSIGGIKEDILKSWFSVQTLYTLTNAAGEKIAESGKFDLGATDFTIKDNQGSQVASLHRPWINFLGDEWNVKVTNPEAVDPLMLVMIGAFKTDADNKKSDATSLQQNSPLRNAILSLAAQGILCGIYFL